MAANAFNDRIQSGRGNSESYRPNPFFGVVWGEMPLRYSDRNRLLRTGKTVSSRC